MNAQTRAVGGILVAVLCGVGLAACSDDDSSDPAVDGCGLTSPDLLTEVLGDDLDESTGPGADGLSDEESRTAECTTTVVSDSDTFLIVQVYEPPADFYEQNAQRVLHDRTTCAEPLPLEVEGAEGWICSESAGAGGSETVLRAVWPAHSMRILLDRSSPQDSDPDDVREVAREAAEVLDLDSAS
jgi:hypothetical protein